MTYDPVARALAKNAITMATIAKAEVHDAQVGAAASATTATSQANLASSKADMATGQALAAAASQTAAAQSATTATTKATTATTQAGIATTQASIASAASSSASALLQSFRGVFMGALPTDAAANAFATAQSIALSSGVMYENTTSGKFRIWSGSAWGDYDATAAASQASAALAASQASASATIAAAQAGIATTGATTATAQAGIATTQAGIATTGGATATTQAGIATTAASSAAVSAATATTQANTAATQAATATTQASSAATQAGIATTGAATATTQAGIATTGGATATAQATAAAASAAAAAGKSAHLNLWSNIATKSFDGGVTALFTGGYATAGIGAGFYVNDALATAALAISYPALCRQSADGRYWRLQPTNGQIEVEQAGALGDPTGTGLVNDQVPIQAAVSYAAKMGIPQVNFSRRLYAIWMPRRTSSIWTAAPDGQGIAIPALTCGTITLKGMGKNTQINYFNIDGTSLATNWQTIAVDGNPWRGSAIYVYSPAVDPGLLMRPAVTLDSLYLEGGTLANGNLNWANPITDAPNGLDITNKGILVQPDAFSGDTIIRNSRISGFRGELVYSSNNSSSRLILEGRCEFSESNGQALNPAGGGIYCPGYVVVWNCNVAFEGWCGMGNLRGEFHNILRGGTITGGVIYQGPNGFFPQRLTEAQFAGQASYFHLDIMITSPQQTIQLGSFFRGKVIAVDTQIGVGSDPTAGPFKGGVIDTDLEIITVVDKASLQTALTLAGSTVSGAKSITNCRYRLSLKRTAAAIAAGYVIVDAVAYGGSIGPDVIIEESSGPSLRGSAPYNQSTQLPDYYPTFRNNAFNRCTDGTTTSHNVSSTPLINVRGDFTGVYNTTNNSTVTATLPTVGIGDGHELTLYNVGGPSGYANVALDRSGGGCILPARRIIGGGDFMRLRFDAVISKWLEVKPPNPMSLNGSITVPAVAANAVSAVQTMTVYGAEPGMAVSISNMNVVSTAYEICQAQVTAANTVSFRVRDVSGAGFASFNLWMEICCEWKRTWLS